MEKDISKFIKLIRETDPFIKTIYEQGGCFRFAEMLQKLFGGELRWNGEHVVLFYEGRKYDINGADYFGEVGGKPFDPEKPYVKMTYADMAKADQWGFAELMECPSCGEEFYVDSNGEIW